jgi:glycine cleavage system H protein
MSDTPSQLRYTQSHEWLLSNDDGSVTVGITDHAQQQLGDLVFIELPEAGNRVSAGDACAVVESVKTASDVYAPIAGSIRDANQGAADNPEQVNQSPYGDGWLFTIVPDDPNAVASFMSADAYQAQVDAES